MTQNYDSGFRIARILASCSNWSSFTEHITTYQRKRRIYVSTTWDELLRKWWVSYLITPELDDQCFLFDSSSIVRQTATEQSQTLGCLQAIRALRWRSPIHLHHHQYLVDASDARCAVTSWQHENTCLTTASWDPQHQHSWHQLHPGDPSEPSVTQSAQAVAGNGTKKRRSSRPRLSFGNSILGDSLAMSTIEHNGSEKRIVQEPRNGSEMDETSSARNNSGADRLRNFRNFSRGMMDTSLSMSSAVADDDDEGENDRLPDHIQAEAAKLLGRRLSDAVITSAPESVKDVPSTIGKI